MNMQNDEYRRYADRHAPRSQVGRNCLGAFLVGGTICCLGQLLFTLFQAAGLDEQAAGTAESVSLIALGALLTALGVYDDLAAIGRAGTLVPITGFSNSVAAPALEFKTEGLVTGTAVKMFSIAGPVIVFGLAASTVYGILLVLFA
ncbi:MAG: SpoVA/SpoVAEb family sporulation membrane protein [Oscillospiraceae bacterium]|jgi:SpoVA protein.|nr:SpoVA/SpoVAEb family sporulation membrane protein [Oscillospiraceae bacterium]